MVYCGPISKGCERCRRRKIKCGRERPRCKQCVSFNQPCGGYRDSIELMFRDETSRIAEKVQRRRPGSGRDDVVVGLSHNCDSGDNPTSYRRTTGGSKSAIIYPVTPSLSERAACFFFANFVSSEPPYSGDYLAWLGQSYAAGQSDSIVPTVIEAVGFAGLSNVFYSPDTTIKAYKAYGRALSLTNKALRDHKTAVEDSTLIAIWFLGVFETINAHRWDSLNSWHSHIEGAAALIEARGDKQFESEVGQLMFAQFRSQIVSACIQRNIRVPKSLTLSGWFGRQNIVAPWVSSGAAVQLADLRVGIANHEFESRRDITEAALSVAAAIDRWETDLLRRSSYETKISDTISAECYLGIYHVYDSVTAAEVWNNIRNLRILTHEIILDCCSGDPSLSSEDFSLDLTEQRNHSIAVIRQTALQICASIPKLLNAMPGEQADTKQRMHPASCGLSLMWPLFIICNSTEVETPLKEWAFGFFRTINSEMGIRQAHLMANTILAGTSPFRAYRANDIPS